MISSTIKDHVKYMNNTHPSSVLVYKGFPNSFIEEVSKEWDFLTSYGKYNNKLIDLESIEGNFSTLIQDISSFKAVNETRILLYEELVFINSKNLDINDFLDSNVIVIENTITKYFPNQTIEKVGDLDDLLREEKNINDNIAYRFYSGSRVINSIQYLQYKGTQEGVISLDYYDTISKTKELKLINSSPSETYIYIDSESEFLPLVNNLFNGIKILERLEIVSSSDDRSSAFKLSSLLDYEGVKYNFYKNNNHNLEQYSLEVRKDFFEILTDNWGYKNFREIPFYKNPDLGNDIKLISQGVLIEQIVSQIEKSKNEKKFSDVFITAPTGAGKSLIFQIPFLYIAKKYNYVTIVISPLIALMSDQIQALHKRGIRNVEYINSEKSPIEREQIIQDIQSGIIDIVYMSPELLLSYDISYFLGDSENGGRELGLLAIDEAHLVTTWGRDFRVDYWYLGNYIKKVRRYNYKFCVLAVTATAVYGGQDDMVYETFDSLNMYNPMMYIGNVKRNDINFKFREFIYEGNYNEKRMEKTKDVIERCIIFKIKSIIYFPYTRHIKEISNLLDISGRKGQYSTYYGSLSKEEKKKTQQDFLNGNTNVILATKAFGMGIDIDDIKLVYHHAPSGNIPDYVQEVGRLARKDDIEGIAEIDYCEKDLNFSKALHGLSSVKQYECRSVLEKLYQIYKSKNNGKKKSSQNFLVSVEDFNHIFGENADIDNKLKNILLLLEKDLLNKYGFNVLIARPKQLFTSTFVSIDTSIEQDFKIEYGKYITFIKKAKDNSRADNRGVKIKDTGDIYKLDLGKIWEDKFNHKSFPLLKSEFYNGKLFGDQIGDKVHPRYRLRISLNKDIDITKNLLYSYIIKFEKVINNSSLLKSYVSEEEIEHELYTEFGDSNLSMRMKEAIIKLYSSPGSNSKGGGFLEFDTFMQVKNSTDGSGKKYRIINGAFGKIKNTIIKKFEEVFSEKDIEVFLSYYDKSNKYSKLANLIEILGLGTYEVQGGEFPQIFIRTNDPYKLGQIVGLGNYYNDIVSNIEERYKRSNNLIDKFFTKMENNQRWDFIEDYFLGKI